MAYNRVQKQYVAGTTPVQITGGDGNPVVSGRLLGVQFFASGTGDKKIFDATAGAADADRIWQAAASAPVGFSAAGGANGVSFSTGLRVILGAAGDNVLVLFSED